MGEYFRIMEEAENDAVLGALQAIVDQVIPHYTLYPSPGPRPWGAIVRIKLY